MLRLSKGWARYGANLVMQTGCTISDFYLGGFYFLPLIKHVHLRNMCVDVFSFFRTQHAQPYHNYFLFGGTQKFHPHCVCAGGARALHDGERGSRGLRDGAAAGRRERFEGSGDFWEEHRRVFASFDFSSSASPAALKAYTALYSSTLRLHTSLVGGF